MSGRRRLYVDSNVLVGAFAGESKASRSVIEAAAAGEFTLIESDSLLFEVLRVFGKLFGKDEAGRAHRFLLDVPFHVVLHDAEWSSGLDIVRPFIRDHADEPHLAAAFVGRADAFVTHNRRSVREGIFEYVPLVSPELLEGHFSQRQGWPTPEAMKADWLRWARRSPRGP